MSDPVHRMKYAIVHDPGPVLSSAEDRVYIINGDNRDLIFEGYAGNSIAIKPVRAGLLVIEYCGGSITKVASFLANRTELENSVAVIVQPVVVSEVSIGGRQVCPAQ